MASMRLKRWREQDRQDLDGIDSVATEALAVAYCPCPTGMATQSRRPESMQFCSALCFWIAETVQNRVAATITIAMSATTLPRLLEVAAGDALRLDRLSLAATCHLQSLQSHASYAGLMLSTRRTGFPLQHLSSIPVWRPGESTSSSTRTS